jgi:integrase
MKALAKAGLRRIRIHDLRHIYASLLIQNGESSAYVRDQLGHHSIQVSTAIWLSRQISWISKRWKIRKIFGATRRSRTGDLLITNQLLYQLS